MTLGPAAPWPSPHLLLEVPAHRDFVASIRALARSAAVLGDLALEDAQEIQAAVDEAATLLLPLAPADAGQPLLRADLTVEPGSLAVSLSIAAEPGSSIDTDGLAWVMLSALDPGVLVSAEDGRVTIDIRRFSRSTTS